MVGERLTSKQLSEIAARTDIPALLAEIETLQTELAEARKLSALIENALELEQAAHGHRRMCGACVDPSLPGNGCPKHREMHLRAIAANAHVREFVRCIQSNKLIFQCEPCQWCGALITSEEGVFVFNCDCRLWRADLVVGHYRILTSILHIPKRTAIYKHADAANSKTV